LITFILSDWDYSLLDSFLSKKARCLLRGKACDKDSSSSSHFVAQSNKEVLRRLGSVPSLIELIVLRLGWMQQVFKMPGLHVLFLASLFSYKFKSRKASSKPNFVSPVSSASLPLTSVGSTDAKVFINSSSRRSDSSGIEIVESQMQSTAATNQDDCPFLSDNPYQLQFYQDALRASEVESFRWIEGVFDGGFHVLMEDFELRKRFCDADFSSMGVLI
jgi:hypothetical protein